VSTSPSTTTDELVDQVQAAYLEWRSTPRWRWWRRFTRREAWMLLVSRLQDREQLEAIERRRGAR
jgi:hypothetical protein